jgi:membrane dipeptidase
MLDAAELHRSLLTIDTHIDIPWPHTPDPFAETRLCVDFPKMSGGRLWAGCFAAYVPQGPRTPEGFAAAQERALAMLETIRTMGRCAGVTSPPPTPTSDELDAPHRAGALAIIPAVENGHAIGEDIGLLRRFRDLGARYLTLTHNGHNVLADSANPRIELGDAPSLHGGLGALGREAVAELNRLGMLVDVSHVSRRAMLQAVELSRTPVIATHSCARALCDHPRNLDDAQLDALRDSGGLIQVTAVPGFVRPRGAAEQVTVADFCEHIDHVVRRCGIDHVGIGSDFDGGGGFVGWRDASENPNVTAELLRRGYGPAEISQIWGGNFLRLLRVAEQEAAMAPT